MMMIKATRDAILKPLQTVAGIVERRHTLPILANVLIRKQGDTVSFLATNEQMQIETSASLGAGKDEAATTVAARKLIDILRLLPDSEVSVSLNGAKLGISAGKSRFSLQTLRPEEFPTVSINPQVVAQLAMPQKQLKKMFAMVHFATADTDTRDFRNVILLDIDGHKIKMVATDGHRLAICTSETTNDLGKHEVLIPRKTVTELQRLLGDTDEPVELQAAGNQIRFRFGEVELLSKLIEFKYPDYRNVIPTGYTRSITVARETLSQALTRASILSTDKFKGVRFTLSNESLQIQTTNFEQEEAIEELDVDYTGELLEIGFNVYYLLDVLGNLKSEKIKVEFGDSNGSALISVPGDESFRYVVMPMRI